jgi:ankyrin repeat protein
MYTNPLLKERRQDYDGVIFSSNNIEIFRLSYKREIENIKALLNAHPQGTIIETRGYYGETPVMHAATSPEAIDVIAFLIKEGEADINKVDTSGATILMYATVNVRCHPYYDFPESLDVLKYLIDNGADYTAVDFKGRTFIDYLPSHKREEMVKYIDEVISLNLKPAKH